MSFINGYILFNIMSLEITVKEVEIEEVLEVNRMVAEFYPDSDKIYFEERYEGKKRLITVAYIDNQPAGYMVSYDRFGDGSFYCWMTGVNPEFRRKGILKRLMNYHETWAQDNGYDKIRLKTRNNRRGMLAYLIKNDFLVTEVERHPKVEDNRIYFEKALRPVS